MSKYITRYYNNNKEYYNNKEQDKPFDGNNENIKTIERLPQVKLLDLSIILYLHHCSEVVICQSSNVKSQKCTVYHWKRMIKCYHRQYVLFLQNTFKSNPHCQFTKSPRIFTVVRNFIFSLNFPSDFAFLMVLRINSHIFGASEDMLSVPQYTVRFLRLCSSGSFLKL